MFNLIKKRHFALPEDFHSVKQKADALNLKRMSLAALIAVPVNLAHIVYFLLEMPSEAGIEYNWRLGIIFSHLFLLISISGFSLMAHRVCRKSDLDAAKYKGLVYLFISVLLISGVAISLIDQWVTSAISPFMVVVVIVASVFLIHPRKSALFFVLGLLGIYILLPLTQTDSSLLLSARVNAITIAGVGFFLSWANWQLNFDRFLQNLVIARQQEKLKDKNKLLSGQAAELREAIATRDMFQSVIAHDLKNPFQALLGFSELLLNRWEMYDDKEKRSMLQNIRGASESTYALLLNLLDWYKLRQGMFNANREAFDFHNLVHVVSHQLMAGMSLKNLRTDIQVEPGMIVFADERMISSVMNNLLSNAVKYAPADSAIVIEAYQKEAVLHVRVADSGPGIADELKTRIFDAAYSRSEPGNVHGSGFGLHLCREFVLMHHGKIWVEDGPQAGSVFCFTIPGQPHENP